MGAVLRSLGFARDDRFFSLGMTDFFAGDDRALRGRQLREHFSASMARTTIKAHRALSGSGTSMT